MRILLIGEYSRLHNSLKEGLELLQNEVVLVASGDGFKNFPSTFSIQPKFCENWVINKIRQGIIRLFNFDVEYLERGLRFFLILKKLKNFDVVQLINERPIQTTSFLEVFLLKRIIKNNKKMFLLSAGVDFLNVRYMMDNPNFKGVLQPYFKNKMLKPAFEYVFLYLKKSHQKLHHFVLENCKGIIASDMDYVIPLQGNTKFLKLIPNPINISALEHKSVEISSKINIFLGINRGTYHQKGIPFFEDALKIISQKYSEKVTIEVVENIPYKEYINKYNNCHILLDQTYAHDQGYNALEAMAKGKVVFTGAEIEFEQNYGLTEKVAINAKPNVDYLVSELSFLIENPSEILKIGAHAKQFIVEDHDFIKVAKQYLETWNEISE
jgi:glycosyltransferase involved in cell wall biosynthesis